MSPPVGVRRLWLDEAPGERRGVVWLDGRPERLWLEREGEEPDAPLGARLVGRIAASAGDRVFVRLPAGPHGVLRLPAGAAGAEGSAVAVEVAAEADGGKGPRLTWLDAAEGPPRLLTPAPALEERLRACAPGVALERGPDARDAADGAEAAVVAVTHRFRGGLVLHVEPTRALTAVDVDLAPAAGGAMGARRLREANLSAIRHAVRLLRLKALGGAAVLDLAGLPAPADRGLLRAEAARALLPDGPEAEAEAPDRRGLLILTRPRRARALRPRLVDAAGRPTPRAAAQRLLRDVERQAAAEPGSRWSVAAPGPVADELAPWLPALGPRFTLQRLAADGGEAHIRPL